jgi:hypothetical protein
MPEAIIEAFSQLNCVEQLPVCSDWCCGEFDWSRFFRSRTISQWRRDIVEFHPTISSYVVFSVLYKNTQSGHLLS